MKCPECGKDSGTSVQCPDCGTRVVPSTLQTGRPESSSSANAVPPQSVYPENAAGSDSTGSEAKNPVEEMQSWLDIIYRGEFPPYLAQLQVGDKYKRAFALYEVFRIPQPGGVFPQPSKEIQRTLKAAGYKTRRQFNRLLLANVWWAFFFGPFYYLFSGMWRKGLVLFPVLIAAGFVIDAVYYMITGDFMPHSVNTGIAASFGYMMSVMAMYDNYRFRLKGETFWW